MVRITGEYKTNQGKKIRIVNPFSGEKGKLRLQWLGKNKLQT